MTHHDDARRLGTAARDTQEESHPEVGDRVLVQRLDCDTGGFANLGRAFRKRRRRQHVGRLVAELPRDIRRLTENATALDCGFDFGWTIDRIDDDENLIDWRSAALPA